MARWFETFSIPGFWQRRSPAEMMAAGPATPAAVARDGREHGATGTPNYGGWITGEDYNPKLDGKAAMKVYDEMRRSDAQVGATLNVVKLPVRSADWRVDPPEHGDAQDLAIAEFCQDVLFGAGDWRADQWRQVLQHLLLKLDFGVSVLEKVWTIADDGTARLRKLAPRLPHTIERWNIDEIGRLTSIVQLAPKADQFQELTIPADYAVVSNQDREGDNWWGRSILRPGYIHWYYKGQLYRIDAVKHDRYGVGIPVAEIQEDYTTTTEENRKIDAILKGIRSHEKAWIRTTAKVKYSILVPPGGQGGTNIMPSIDHHNAMIARTVLAGFLSQGEQKHGSFGLGGKLADIFTSVVETVADETADDLNTQVIRQLCDLNCNMRGRPYPTVRAMNIADTDAKELTEAVARLGPKYITPEDDLEGALRTVMNLPPLPEQFKGRDRTPAPTPPLGEPEPAGPGRDDATAAGTKAPTAQDQDREREALRARLRQLRDGYITASGCLLGRPPTAFELAVFGVEDVPVRLEQAAASLASEMARVRRLQLDAILAEAVRKDQRTWTGDFTDIRPRDIGLPLTAALRKAIRAMQTSMAAYGAEQVQLEAQRQGITVLHALDAVDASARAAQSALVSSAQIAAERMSDTWYGRILETVLSERRSGKQGDALKAAVEARLAENVEKAPLGEARAEVNEAFAIGRAGQAAARKDGIETVQYSSLMDTNTCAPCAALDGTQFPFQSDEYYRTLPPFSGCDGNKGRPDACRCVHLYLFKGRTV